MEAREVEAQRVSEPNNHQPSKLISKQVQVVKPGVDIEIEDDGDDTPNSDVLSSNRSIHSSLAVAELQPQEAVLDEPQEAVLDEV